MRRPISQLHPALYDIVETSLLTRNHALVKYPVDAADLASITVMAT